MSEPKISLNKLGEYLDATPARRRRIVQDQIDPKTFIAARYSDAREEISVYLATNKLNDEQLINAASNLRNQQHESKFIAQDKSLSADAIDDFLEIADQVGADGYKLEKGSASEQVSMNISGVIISVRPDVYVKNDNNEIVGAIKLHFPKSNPLNEKSSEYIATCLRVYLEGKYDASKIDYKLCTVVDIPSGSVVNAPKATKKRMQDITAACEEIEARWKNTKT